MLDKAKIIAIQLAQKEKLHRIWIKKFAALTEAQWLEYKASPVYELVLQGQRVGPDLVRAALHKILNPEKDEDASCALIPPALPGSS